MENKNCSATKRDGSSCNIAAMEGSDFCFFHDPSRSEERRTAQSLGGRGNHIKTLSEDAPDIKITSNEDIVSLLALTINQARKGEIDTRIANTVGYLATIAMAAIDKSDLEKQIQKLQALHQARLTALNGV